MKHIHTCGGSFVINMNKNNGLVTRKKMVKSPFKSMLAVFILVNSYSHNGGSLALMPPISTANGVAPTTIEAARTFRKPHYVFFPLLHESHI